MNSFKEKFKIAKLLASIFTHSSTTDDTEYRELIGKNPEENQRIADRILNRDNYEENIRLLESFSSKKAWEKLHPLLEENPSGISFWKKSLKYAALFLLLSVPSSYLI